MPRSQSNDARFRAIQYYLERAFPGCVERVAEHDFEVFHGSVRHQVVIHPEAWHRCADYMGALRESELVDYMREAQSQQRRFLIRWQDEEVRVRSTPL